MSAADHWNDHYQQGKASGPSPRRRPRCSPSTSARAAAIGPSTRAAAPASTPPLHDPGFTTTGVDFSQAAITTAQNRHPDRDGLDFRLLDTDRGGPALLPPGTFDLVTCRLFLLLVDLVPTVACARRLLTPGGRLLVTAPIDSRPARRPGVDRPARGRPPPPAPSLL
ncbi:class I SAM-dependent methyltransferase [Kitasatospora sp. NPDC056327]|uniref:class I SAM-dependent methyltransferase n=1 Tax=Kitasatospora sp. NPDC056327 TaxID=3345785 RepID=UPI0035E0102A